MRAELEKYVEKQLVDKDQLPASHFPLDHIEDFIKIIYIRLYGQRKNMRYSMDRRNGSVCFKRNLFKERMSYILTVS